METNKVKVSVESLVIPTYPEGAVEELPMFAETRAHQRSSGNPYPNKVIIEPRGKQKYDKAYTIVKLENEYLEIGIMPEIGGRIFYAMDKKTGYDFFYRQHVIKPSFIGIFGSWISGGVEFNWPYHHRPSTFMPVDYEIVHEEDGSAIVWLSEHDPVDRMKGMVGIRLAPGKAILETRVKLANRTSLRHSFLWWENAAVPVNTDYELFFPPDVNHVYFHYRRSLTSFPIAHGKFNGMRFPEGGKDISKHKNTYHSTSYFSASSQYDFFGGYDNGKNCGVVHVADHNVATGKKMFTWGYNQLAKSWGGALTDTDGAYAELMAGSYTNNQPDFSWIEPYETKNFSQFWYPISNLGAATYANYDCALHVGENCLKVQVTAPVENAHITLKSEGKIVLDTVATLMPGGAVSFDTPAFNCNAYEVTIGDVAHYVKEDKENTRKGEMFCEVPYPTELDTAEKRTLAGIHFKQYRDATQDPVVYFKAALELDPEFTPALTALGEHYCEVGEYENAREVLEKALALTNRYNINPQSGKISYLLGLAYKGLGENDLAHAAFYKAAWNEAQVSCGMTMTACIDGKRGDWSAMLDHAGMALKNNTENPLANVLVAAADLKLGRKDAALAKLYDILRVDPLNHLARYFLVVAGKMSEADFFAKLHSSPSQTCLDLAFDLLSGGFDAEAEAMLRGVEKYTTDVSPVIRCFLGETPTCPDAHRTFPNRPEEIAILEGGKGEYAKYLLGCLHYGARRYDKAEELWSTCTDWKAMRNMAVCRWRKGDRGGALAYLDRAHEMNPDSAQVIFEIAYLMNNAGMDAGETIAKIESMVDDYKTAREDIVTEWACACNRAGKHEKAYEMLVGRSYLPCEGGETALAKQYIDALNGIGKALMAAGDYEKALAKFREGQILPDNLQAGLWHEGTIVPVKYSEALCLRAMGREEEACEVFSYIANLYVDFFSNLNIAELPHYMCASKIRLGDVETGKREMRAYIEAWEHELTRRQSGYFKQSPFFISYMNDPVEERVEHYSRLIRLAEKVLEIKA